MKRFLTTMALAFSSAFAMAQEAPPSAEVAIVSDPIKGKTEEPTKAVKVAPEGTSLKSAPEMKADEGQEPPKKKRKKSKKRSRKKHEEAPQVEAPASSAPAN